MRNNDKNKDRDTIGCDQMGQLDDDNGYDDDNDYRVLTNDWLSAGWAACKLWSAA